MHREKVVSDAHCCLMNDLQLLCLEAGLVQISKQMPKPAQLIDTFRNGIGIGS